VDAGAGVGWAGAGIGVGRTATGSGWAGIGTVRGSTGINLGSAADGTGVTSVFGEAGLTGEAVTSPPSPVGSGSDATGAGVGTVTSVNVMLGSCVVGVVTGTVWGGLQDQPGLRDPEHPTRAVQSRMNVMGCLMLNGTSPGSKPLWRNGYMDSLNKYYTPPAASLKRFNRIRSMVGISR